LLQVKVDESHHHACHNHQQLLHSLTYKTGMVTTTDQINHHHFSLFVIRHVTAVSFSSSEGAEARTVLFVAGQKDPLLHSCQLNESTII